VVHAYNSSTPEMEAGGWSRPGPHSETVSKKELNIVLIYNPVIILWSIYLT
jgi:hypothetical protein